MNEKEFQVHHASCAEAARTHFTMVVECGCISTREFERKKRKKFALHSDCIQRGDVVKIYYFSSGMSAASCRNAYFLLKMKKNMQLKN